MSIYTKNERMRIGHAIGLLFIAFFSTILNKIELSGVLFNFPIFPFLFGFLGFVKLLQVLRGKAYKGIIIMLLFHLIFVPLTFYLNLNKNGNFWDLSSFENGLIVIMTSFLHAVGYVIGLVMLYKDEEIGKLCNTNLLMPIYVLPPLMMYVEFVDRGFLIFAVSSFYFLKPVILILLTVIAFKFFVTIIRDILFDEESMQLAPQLFVLTFGLLLLILTPSAMLTKSSVIMTIIACALIFYAIRKMRQFVFFYDLYSSLRFASIFIFCGALLSYSLQENIHVILRGLLNVVGFIFIMIGFLKFQNKYGNDSAYFTITNIISGIGIILLSFVLSMLLSLEIFPYVFFDQPLYMLFIDSANLIVFIKYIGFILFLLPLSKFMVSFNYQEQGEAEF